LPTVEQIVEAFVSPLLMMEVLPVVPLLGRVFSNPSHFLERVYKKHLIEVVKRFSDAIAVALPALPSEDRFWRLQFMAGSMSHLLALSGVLPIMSGRPLDRSAVMERLVTFLAAGLRAPATLSALDVAHPPIQNPAQNPARNPARNNVEKEK